MSRRYTSMKSTVSTFGICSMFIGVLLLAPLFQVSRALALDIPANDGYVTDAAGILTADQKKQLTDSLGLYKQQTSSELAVLTIPSLQGGDIADFGVKVFRQWGIGTKANNNG